MQDFLFAIQNFGLQRILKNFTKNWLKIFLKNSAQSKLYQLMQKEFFYSTREDFAGYKKVLVVDDILSKLTH